MIVFTNSTYHRYKWIFRETFGLWQFNSYNGSVILCNCPTWNFPRTFRTPFPSKKHVCGLRFNESKINLSPTDEVYNHIGTRWKDWKHVGLSSLLPSALIFRFSVYLSPQVYKRKMNTQFEVIRLSQLNWVSWLISNVFDSSAIWIFTIFSRWFNFFCCVIVFFIVNIKLIILLELHR